MNIEKDWPTLVEANHVKVVKKKYNIKKKSSWVKVNTELNFIKTDSSIDNKDGKLAENGNKLPINNGTSLSKGMKRSHATKSNLIRPFNNESDELYCYREDPSALHCRQRSLCKQVPLKHNIASVLIDATANELYCEYLNEYLAFVNCPPSDSPYSYINQYNGKSEIESDKSKNSDMKIPNQPIYENEIMYVRGNVLSYYFSEMNLCNDNYLMKIMDDNGWVNLDDLLKFPRLLKTKTTVEDVIIISKEIKYPDFESKIEKSKSEAVLQLQKEEENWKIRRSDMSNFRKNLLVFGNKDYKPQPHELPYPKYTYNYFLNNLHIFQSTQTKENNDVYLKNHDWTEVKPKVRRSRKSESCVNENPNNNQTNNQDNLDFEFSSEPNPLQSKNNSSIRRKQVSKRSMERSRSRTFSGGSEDELDESNIYILSMKPKSLHTKTLNWADISDSDDESDVQISTNIQSKYNISQRLLAKHPSGDRHPNPDYQSRSKVQEQLREIISDGLKDWKNNTEIIRRNRRDSSSSTSSDIKVQMCQDEKTFKLMQKSLQNHDNKESGDDPKLPTLVMPIEQKVEVMKQKTVNVMHFKPLPDETSTLDCDFLVESSTSSLLNPIHYNSWNPPFSINNSLNKLLDKLLENVQYEYLNINTSAEYKSADYDKPKPENHTKTELLPSKTISDVRKDLKMKRSCKVGFYPVTKVGPAKDKLKDKTRASNPVEEYDVGYAYSGRQSSHRRQRTISGSTYSQYNDAGYAVAHGIPIPFNDHPSQLLLQENGFEIKFYHVFRKESLADREKKGIGRSQEMNTLFRFWSFFLRENKNKKMYEEFQKYAWEDAVKGYRYGVECLFRMYTYKLEQRKHFTEQQYQDFQKNVLKDVDSGHLYGLEKFWAFLTYSGRKVDAHPKIKKLLEKYKTLDDFRINFIPPQGFHSYKIEHPEQSAVESGIESE